MRRIVFKALVWKWLVFCNISETEGFWKQLSRNKVSNIQVLNQFEKVTVQKSIAKLRTVISNQMMNYRLPHTRFDQISDHENDIYLYGKPGKAIH